MRLESLDAAAYDSSAEEPIGSLRARVDGQGERMLPLFRRAAEIVVGRGASCSWRFILPSLAEEQLRLCWDGVRLKVQELDPACATRLGGAPLHQGLHPVRPGQPIQAAELEIEFELQLFSDEVTQVRRIVLPPEPARAAAEPPPTEGGAPPVVVESALPVAVAVDGIAPASAAPERPWRCYLPPRNGAADDEPTKEWSLDDALRPTADLLERLSNPLARRLPRRRLALLGAIAVAGVAALLVVSRAPPRPAAALSAPASFVREQADDGPPRVMQPDKQLEVTLRQGIEAYRSGKSAEAIARFEELTRATGDPAARLMTFVLRSRGAATP